MDTHLSFLVERVCCIAARRSGDVSVSVWVVIRGLSKRVSGPGMSLLDQGTREGVKLFCLGSDRVDIWTGLGGMVMMW